MTFGKLSLNLEPMTFDDLTRISYVGTKGVSQNHLLSFDDNKVLKIINWIC